jgi:hypothetical protein
MTAGNHALADPDSPFGVKGRYSNERGAIPLRRHEGFGIAVLRMALRRAFD